MKNKFLKVASATLLCCATLVNSLTIVSAATPTRSMSIAYDKPNYTYSKMEPKKGTLLGAYVLQDDYINQSMETFNEVTEKQHASYFKYVGYGRPFPTEWVEEVKAAGAIPHIAFEPNGGLEKVVDDEYLRQWAADAKAADVPIFIRWASEMNGTWTQYSGHSDLYKEKWKLVYNVFKEEAPNCSFVWTVFTFPESTIQEFYPGDAYVDWVGVNIYNVIYHNNDINSKADQEDPLELLDYVYNTYSYKKPIQISEFGVTHYTSTDGKTYSNWASDKITELYSNIGKYYPRVKSIFYFDVNNVTAYNADRRINDYSVTTDSVVLNAYKNAISTSNFLSSYTENTEKSGTERLTYNGFTHVYNSRLHAPIDFFKNYMGLTVTKVSNNTYKVSNGTKSVNVNSRTYRQKTSFGITRTFTTIPVVPTLKSLGYTVAASKEDNMVYVK